MKYFTPALYTDLQDFTSDEAMNLADAAWEEAVDRYDAYYRSIAGQLPSGFRELQDNFYLRDASVRAIGRRDNQLLIVLTLDAPPHALLLVRYDLDGQPRLDREALHEALRSKGGAHWLHDEVEVVSRAPLRCVHSVQLSNGLEVQIPFRDIHVEQAEAI
jgi:hypothetical protein